jgi:hypothetical protein
MKTAAAAPARTVSDFYTDDLGTPCRDVCAGDELLTRLEYYRDTDPERPEAFERFRRRMHGLPAEYDQWATIVFDNVTSLEYAARMLDQFKINKSAKDGRQHYIASASAIEMMLYGRAGSMPMNVVTIAHVSESKDEVHGGMIYNPAAPGQQSKKLPSGYSELYHASVKSEGGKNTFLLQTEKSAQFNAKSQIPAPNPAHVLAGYEGLWPAHDPERYPIHLLIYGDAGSMKSTFAATFPKPMLVFYCDAMGNDRPYLREMR